MKILALDTATENCSAALLIDGQLTSREMEFDRGHAEHILPMIDLLLIEAGLRLAEVDAIAFGRGPGGFTGVRLAASIAQGLAFGAGLPVVPVSNLAALAQRAFDLAFAPDRVLVCSDARMLRARRERLGQAAGGRARGAAAIRGAAGRLGRRAGTFRRRHRQGFPGLPGAAEPGGPASRRGSG
jgi:hypothetical protein